MPAVFPSRPMACCTARDLVQPSVRVGKRDIHDQYVEPSYAVRLVEDHPERVGYVLKERVFDVAVLVDALRRVADSESVVDPTIVAQLLDRRRRHDPLADLTRREREVLGLVAEGLSNQAIAARLFVTEPVPRPVTEARAASIAPSRCSSACPVE